jgi:chromosomal replication initiation ATPase DnaA
VHRFRLLLENAETVRSLKDLIFREVDLLHIDDLVLLKGSRRLDDDTMTLFDLGLKENTRLIVTRRSYSPQDRKGG